MRRAEMQGQAQHRVASPPSVAQAARWPAGVLALTLLALGVLWLHALALQGLSQALPTLDAGAGAPLRTPVFSTRTLPFERDPAPVAVLASAPLAPAAQNPTSPATTTLTSTPTTPTTPTAAPVAPKPLAPADAVPATAATAAAVAPIVGAPLTPNLASNVASNAAPNPAPNPSPTPKDAGTASAAPLPVYDYLVPASTRLKYDVSGLAKGFRYHVAGDLLWLQDGKSYDARLEISHFLLGSRVQSSKGALTPQGLEPLRFGDKARSEVAAHFQRAKGLVSFSANTPDAPLMPLAQDQLSIFVQLAAMWGANPARFTVGMPLPFQAVGPRTSENWVFVVGAPERLKIDDRELPAVKLLRDRSGDYDTRVELWLAPALDYLPARIRLTQGNGDEVDMLWSRSEKP